MQMLKDAQNNRAKKINKIEKVKENTFFNDIDKQLKSISQNGYENLSKDDSSFFLKCFGVFDKGENSFMIRLRIPAGRLSNTQAIAIGQIAKEYGDDYIDITTRQQIELRYIKSENLYDVITKLKAVGVSTYQTGIDNFRNIVTSSLDGLLASNIVETYHIIQELQEIFFEKTQWLGVLPRKFNTAILGDISNDCNIYGNDCCFIVAKKDEDIGFNVYLGGKVGVQASNTGLFVKQNEVKMFFLSLANMYKEYGFRDNRNKNRLHFLIESVGMSEFVLALKKYAKYDFSSSGQSMVTQEKITHDITKLKDASNAVHLSIASGVFSGSDLIEVASYTSNIRLTIEQSLYLIGLSDEEVLVFQNSKIYEKYSKYNNNFFINSIACAGTATCSFGLIACKPDALEMGNKLYKKFGDIGSKVRLYWSACPKGCGIHGIADIGFEGCKIKDKNGDKVDGVHIYIGGKASFEVLEARMLYKSLLLSEAYIYVEKIISYYLAYRNQNESFECFDTRVFSQLEIENILHKIG